MIHILFGPSPAGGLKVALKDLGLEKKDSVISFWDMFSVGPIRKLHEMDGTGNRLDWMKRLIDDRDILDFQLTNQQAIDKLQQFQQVSMLPFGLPIMHTNRQDYVTHFFY
jgi:hypothetical protein